MMRNYNFKVDRLGDEVERDMPLPTLEEATNIARGMLSSDKFAKKVKFTWDGNLHPITIERVEQ